jgi:uncharacterized phiE125 gp8 family phage protein
MTDTNVVQDTLSRGINYPHEWTLTRLTDPDIEPVTRAEAKLHCKIDDDLTADDSLVDALITTAREWVEDYTGRALIDQTWQLTYQGYSYNEIKLNRSPVIEIDSFVYDVSGVATTLAAANYEVSGSRTKWPKIIPAVGGSWPSNNWTRPLTIQFRAGYADRSGSPTEGAEKVPEAFKHAIKLLVGHWYENREADPKTDIPMAVKWILNPQRCELGIV